MIHMVVFSPLEQLHQVSTRRAGMSGSIQETDGDLCSPCVQSYSASGMSVQNGKISEYRKNAVAKATDANNVTRQVFLDMRAHWIKNSNEEHRDSSTASGKKRLSLKSLADLKQRFVEVRKSTSTAVQGREKYFVEEQHWDEKKGWQVRQSQGHDSNYLWQEENRHVGVYGQGGCVGGDNGGKDIF